MKKWISLLVGLSLLGLTAVGCTTASEDAAKKETTKELKPFTLMLDWYPNAVHSFLYVAKEKGYFAEAGLDVQLQPPADANDPLKLVAAGQADAAISYQRQVIQSRAQDIPVVSLAAIVRHPLNQVMVRADTGVKSPKDLAGLTVGYASSDIDVSLVKSMITFDGGDPEKVNFVDIGYDLLPSMLTKKVDAIIGGYINHEKLLIEKNGMALTLLDPVQYGAPDNHELVLITGEQQIKEKQDVLKAFWEACRKAQKDVTADPKAGLATLLKQEMQEFPLEADVEAISLDILLPLMNPSEGAFGVQSASQWQSVIDWMKSTKHIDKDLKADDLFRNL